MRKYLANSWSNFQKLGKIGIRRIQDFYDADGRIIKSQEAIRRGMPEDAKFEWIRMRAAVVKAGIEEARNDKWSMRERMDENNKPPLMRLGNESINWIEATQKKILRSVARLREVTLTPHQERLSKMHGVTTEEWNNLYRYIKKHSIATKKRDFLYKWISMGTYTNARFVKFGVKNSAKCHYCECEKQDFLHLFEKCDEVNSLRDRLAARWAQKPTMKEWLLGRWNGDEKDRAITFICFELNHYVHVTNWEGADLSLTKFKSRLRAIEFIERRIAMKKLKLDTHDKKWKDIHQLLG